MIRLLLATEHKFAVTQNELAYEFAVSFKRGRHGFENIP